MVAHRIAGKKLGRPKDQRRALLRSLAAAVIRHEQITTTEAKAVETRRFVERLITYGKKGALHNRRLALAQLPNKEAIQKVFDDLASRYASRPGGYTRMIKLGRRKGDSARMALIELV
jgi:large subunit ribosomal protein L17